MQRDTIHRKLSVKHTIQNLVSLKYFPFALLLFPAFYLLNLQNQFSGILSLTSLGLHYLVWTAILFVLYGLVNRWLKKPKAAIVAVIFGTLVYFYAFPLAVLFRNTKYLQLLNSFTWLVLAWLILTSLLLLAMKKSKTDWQKAWFWLQTTCLLLLAYEAFLLVSQHYKKRNENFDIVYRPSKPAFKPVLREDKPNIYFLLYDGFTSSSVLSSQFGYSLKWLEDSLQQQGFEVSQHSNSNYLLSPVSLAATFNMGYLPMHKTGNNLEKLILLNGLKNLNNNHLFRFLHQQQYRIVNLSIFSIDSSKTPLSSSYPGSSDADLIQMKTLSNTKLPGSLKQLFRTQKEKFFDKKIFNILENLQTTESGLQEVLDDKKQKPYFVYIHEIIPHHPYVFDRSGKQYKVAITNPANPDAYVQQLEYTSKLLLKRVQLIRQKDPSAVVIVQGDHGYRHFPAGTDERAPFGILNAVCFPGRNTKPFYDSVSSVNTFRILLNEYFGQQLPMLKDSLFELKQFQHQLQLSH